MSYSKTDVARLLAILLVLLSAAYLYDIAVTGYNVAAQTTVYISGCGDGTCQSGENCPSDSSSCTDLKCYEPTCTSGCELAIVSYGSTDEACYGDSGCSGGSCKCDGTGNCVSTAAVGGFAGGGSATVPEKKAEVYDFSIIPNIIKIEIKEGSSEQRQVNITNTGNKNLDFAIEVKSLSKLVVPSENSFSLGVNKTKTLTLNIFATQQPDVYTGQILVKTGNITKAINVIIEIKPLEPLFDVNIRAKTKEIIAGGKIQHNITATNLGDKKPVDVEIEYIIKDMNGNIIDSSHETMAINDTLSIERELRIPEYAVGYYVVYAKLTYGNRTATSSDIFFVRKLDVTKLPPINFAAIAIIVIVLAAVYMVFAKKVLVKNRRTRRKKR